MKKLSLHVLTCMLSIIFIGLSKATAAPPYETEAVSLFDNTPSTVSARHAEHRLAVTPYNAVAAGNTLSPAEENNSNARHARKTIVKPSSVNDFAGEWIMSYSPLVTTSAQGGNSIKFTPVEGSNEVEVTGFWRSSTVLSATYDADEGCIKIPYQYIISHTSYGRLYLGVVNPSTGNVMSTESVEVYLNADGTLYIPTWWGIYITSGDYQGQVTDAYYKTSCVRGNATMTHVIDGETSTYPIIAEQTSGNVVQVSNVCNLGKTIEIQLNRDKTAKIESQLGYTPSASAKYYTVGNIVLNDKGNPSSWDDNIIIPAGSDPTKLTWSGWSMIYGSAYWLGYIGETTINFPFELQYPAALASTEFQGEGTESSPYLIKTIDDLELLANNVNSNNELNYFTADSTYIAKVYLGKYFRLENDIDFNNLRFSGIGNDGVRHFAGTFDGNGHKLQNIDIFAATRYASLFGQVDTLGVIKNLTVENAHVVSSGLTPAVISSECQGSIDNCHVINSSVTTSVQGAAGIAGVASSITNSSVENTTITSSEGFCGGIAAQIVGPISGCNATGMNIKVSVTGTSIPPVGGIVGSSNNYRIENCYFAGNIDGSSSTYPSRIGGITGSATAAVISKCFSAVVITPVANSYSYTGGIAGAFFGNMLNCYSTGRIACSSSKYVGGLVGLTQYQVAANNAGVYVATFDNCYSTASIDANLEDYDTSVELRELVGAFYTGCPPNIKTCYYNKQITDFGSLHSATTAQLTSASGPEGFDASAWVYTEGLYPRIKGLDDNEAAMLSATAIEMPETVSYSLFTKDATVNTLGNTQIGFINNGKFSTQGKYGYIDGKTLRLNSESKFGTDSIAFANGNMLVYAPVNLLPIPYEGLGTADSPYLIKTKEDMITLCNMTTKSGVSYADMHFKMTNDIDMEYTTDFTGISFGGSSTKITFRGVFDGGGYALHRLRINGLVWKVRPEDDPEGLGTVDTDNSTATYTGLVGRLASTGVIRNLTIAADCDYQVFSSAGAFAGWSSGLIENCKNYADIHGQSSWIGGIAGQSLIYSEIVNCYNAGNVYCGYRNGGGIVGQTHGLIENCVNSGDVYVQPGYKRAGSNGLKYAGGIAGGLFYGAVRNCLNQGYVYAAEGNAGGITGSAPKAGTAVGDYTNDIYTSISYGIVECGDITTTGALAGEGGSQGIFQYALWDGQILPIGAIANDVMKGCQAVTTAYLTSGADLEGFDNSIWQFSSGSYPVLKAFASEEKVSLHAGIIASFAEGTDALDMTKEATLTPKDGLTWSLAKGTSFSLKDNIVTPPATYTTVVADTLCANYKNIITKRIPLRVIPEIGLKGAGSESNPYLISSTTDWNTLADFMNNSGNTLEDMFFKVTDDIDFTGSTFNIMGTYATAFCGTLDGNGKTIKGYEAISDQQYHGTFNTIGSTGTVKDLTLAGKVHSTYATTSTTTKAYVGGFAGKLYGTLENCVFADSVIADKSYAGGIAAYAYSGANFYECVNKGVVSAVGYIGGIAAEIEKGCTFIGCGNEGNLNVTGLTTTSACYIGGIVSRANESTFIDCYNDGSFTFAKPDITPYVSGIAAYIGGIANGPGYVFKRCVNRANIEARGEISGITGYTVATVGYARMQVDSCANYGNLSCITTSGTYYNAGISTRYKPGSTYTDCVNYGTITSTKCTNVGGIIGATSGVPTSVYPVTITGCKNYGEINATNGVGAGIVGTLNTYSYIRKCENYGNINGSYGLGGIVGALYGAISSVEDCINIGNITSTTSRIGGIVGYLGSSGGGASSVISGCLNLGDVATTCTTQGTSTTTTAPSGFAIGGIVGLSPASISNCANLGSVTGASQVGGIIGCPVVKKTKVVSCYNAGKVIAPVDTCGNIIGINTNNGKLWTADNEITSSYYISDNGTFANDILGTSVKAAELAKLELDDKTWANGDNYSFPIPVYHADNDAANLYAAQIIPADGDSKTKITKAFNVGSPADITWTSDRSDIIAVSGNNAEILASYTGDITMSATLGDFSRSETISIDAVTGIDNLYDGKEIVSATYYTISGLTVEKPASPDGQIYIVVIRYSDGSARTVKLINK